MKRAAFLVSLIAILSSRAHAENPIALHDSTNTVRVSTQVIKASMFPKSPSNYLIFAQNLKTDFQASFLELSALTQSKASGELYVQFVFKTSENIYYTAKCYSAALWNIDSSGTPRAISFSHADCGMFQTSPDNSGPLTSQLYRYFKTSIKDLKSMENTFQPIVPIDHLMEVPSR